jgi:hypothetical protein
MVAIGTIVRTHQNQGIIEVKIQNGFELHELHNVAINGVTNGQFLQYNSGSGLWLASSSGNFSTLNVNGTGVSISGHTHTSSNITNFNSSVSGLLPVGTANYLSKFGTGGSGLSNSLVFDNGTSVGINTVNPSGKFHIESLVTNNSFILLSSPNNVIKTHIGVGNSDTVPFLASTNNIQLASGNNGWGFFDRGSDGALQIQRRSGSTSWVGVVLFDRNNGNVGIGTDNPLAKLHVVGDVLSSGSFIAGSGTAALPSFEFTGDPDTGLFSPATNAIAISTSGVERLRVDSVGNVGIGSTPQVGIKLDVFGDTLIRGSISSNNIFFGYATDYSAVRYQFSNSLTGGGANRSWVCNGGGTFGVGFTAPRGLVAISG